MNMNKPKYMLPGMEGSDPKVLALEATRSVFAETTEGVPGLLLVCSEIQKVARGSRKPGAISPITDEDIKDELREQINIRDEKLRDAKKWMRHLPDCASYRWDKDRISGEAKAPACTCGLDEFRGTKTALENPPNEP
jgi:hypothetical protein